jgi:hypothetical protein
MKGCISYNVMLIHKIHELPSMSFENGKNKEFYSLEEFTELNCQQENV